MLGTLDPLGMPLASLVVAGNCADDPLYLPAWARVRQVVGSGQKLYIGDTKMGALQTRAVIQEGGDYYLMPLAHVGEVPQLLQERLQPVWAGDQALQRIEAVDEGEEAALPMETEAWAQAFEGNRPQQACVEGHDLRFDERVLVVHSPNFLITSPPAPGTARFGGPAEPGRSGPARVDAAARTREKAVGGSAGFGRGGADGFE